MDVRRCLWWLGIGMIMIATTIGVLTILFGTAFSTFQQKCLLTTLLVACFGWTTLAALPKEEEGAKFFTILGWTSCMLGVLLGLQEIWIIWDSSRSSMLPEKWLLTAAFLSLGNAWGSQLWRRISSATAVKANVLCALFGVTVVTLILLSVIWMHDYVAWIEWLAEHWRSIAALVILTVGSSMALPFVARVATHKRTIGIIQK